MTDDRFERDLNAVLREIAGREAPSSLRYRVADVTEQPPARRLWFSPPLRLAAAAVAVVAIAILAVLFVPPELIGPSPSASPESSTPPAVSASPGASASQEATPTQEPTPASTPMVSRWTGLEWSAGVVPFSPNTSYLTDIVPWQGGYVGVGGTLAPAGSAGQGTIFTSADGLHWTISYQAELPEGWSFEYLVPLDRGLLAISDQRGISCPGDTTPCPPAGADTSPRLWYSADGTSWKQIDSPSWRDAAGSTAVTAVAGAMEVVAVLGNGTIAHTADGQTWDVVAGLPATVGAIVRDVAAYPGGFVVVGRDGEPDLTSQVGPQPAPGTGRSAAWFSPDGISWTQAEVEGTAVQGGELREVIAGASGLFATGIGISVDTQWHDPTQGWASSDGQSWHLIGQLGTDLPDVAVMSGYGVDMVIVGAESPASDAMAAFASLDGATWTRLAFSGETGGLPTILRGSPAPGAMDLHAAWIAPDGLLIQGTGDVAQEFWFGAAVEP